MLDTPIVGQLIRVHSISDKETAFSLIEDHTKRGFEVGDFVLAYGSLAEILEVRESDYGNRSYRVLYLAERLLPDVSEDWFPARYIQTLFARSDLLAQLDLLWEKHNLPNDVIDSIRNAPPENFQESLRESVRQLWPIFRAYLESNKSSSSIACQNRNVKDSNLADSDAVTVSLDKLFLE